MTIIKSEAREPYITAVTVPWELLPEPNSAPPLLDMFAADLVLDTAVKWLEARNALAIAGKANGNDLMRAYLDAEELHAGSVALYAAITRSDGYEDDGECRIP